MTLKRPKSKGNRFERWVVDQLQAAGWPHARRNFASGGYGGSDIVDGPSDTAMECKNQEKIAIWKCLEQTEAAARPTDMPVLIFTRNRSRVWAAIPVENLIEFLQARDGIEPDAD